MNRIDYAGAEPEIGMPHASGDEPPDTDDVWQQLDVCPTRVGMNRCRTSGTTRDQPYAPREWG